MARGKNKAASQRKYDRWAEEELEQLRAELAAVKRERLNAERKIEASEPLRQRLAELEAQVESMETPRIDALKATLAAERAQTEDRLMRIGQLFEKYKREGGWSTDEWVELTEVLGDAGIAAFMGDQLTTRHGRRSLEGKRGDLGTILRQEKKRS